MSKAGFRTFLVSSAQLFLCLIICKSKGLFTVNIHRYTSITHGVKSQWAPMTHGSHPVPGVPSTHPLCWSARGVPKFHWGPHQCILGQRPAQTAITALSQKARSTQCNYESWEWSLLIDLRYRRWQNVNISLVFPLLDSFTSFILILWFQSPFWRPFFIKI